MADKILRNIRGWFFGRLMPGVCGLLISASAGAAQDASPDFATEVLPILSDKCFVCHGPDTTEDGSLRLDKPGFAYADRGGYRAVNTEEPGQSELLKRIRSADAPMPPEDAEKQLSSAEARILERWVLGGGQFAEHWAFVPPRRPLLPEGTAPEEAIDYFISHRLSERGFESAPRAAPSVLARRVALILTGLPPEREQLDAYLRDPSNAAYERLVDQLLTSQRFGEHQARYWLDAVRYGDTHGLHLDNRRGIFPYRDWVVRAFNQNLPFDQFINMQLAGDLRPEADLDDLVATGYVRLNPSTGEGGAIAAEFQCKNNFDRVETLGTVFLGLSLTCARCHNHKYDPVTQEDYYRLLDYFNSTAEPALDRNKYDYGTTVRAPQNQQQWAEWEQLTGEIDGALAAAGYAGPFGMERRRQLLSEMNIGPNQDICMGADFPAPEVTADLQKLVERLAELEKEFTTTLVAAELPKRRVTHVLYRGEYDQPRGEALTACVPEFLRLRSDDAADATGDRRELAAWLTDPQHPLVARVLVNRMWQRVFGAGLVRTPEDFGVQGSRPTHPQLLDWLAVQFVESGWDTKRLLKSMVLSRTFQQASAYRPELNDPEDKWRGRGPFFRADAEVLRDLGLWAGGLLDPAMGGEGIRPYQPAGMWKALAHPASNTKLYQQDQGARLYRRSLYMYWKRTSPHPMMTLFDAPDRESSCVRRSRTNTALQSLGLLNETQRIEMARVLAGDLLETAASEDRRLDELYLRLTCRQPLPPERNALLQLLAQLRIRYQSDQESARQMLSAGEQGVPESADVGELAAWTQLCVTVLASDSVILIY